MLRLGGKVLGFSSANSSSAAKGETVADTARVVQCYADIIAMRHPKEGAPLVASMKATVPVINAGDGGHHHPTQTLTDLLNQEDLDTKTTTVDVSLTLVDGQWKITLDEALLDALTGGLLSLGDALTQVLDAA